MDAHTDARYHVHGQDQPDDAGKLITMKAVRSVRRGPVGKRSSNVTFVGWLPYGEAYAVIAGQRQKVQLFVMRLCFSRRTFAMAFPTQRQECFFYGHVKAFEHFGGVPHRISYDNLGTAVKLVFEHSGRAGRPRKEVQAFVSFRSHYLFESHFCTPGQGHEKGQVEHGCYVDKLAICLHNRRAIHDEISSCPFQKQLPSMP
jgi:transposase